MFGIMKNIVNKNERTIKRLRKSVNKINVLEEKFTLLTDEELKAKTEEFKRRLSEGETLDDLLVEAFSVVREASKRVFGMRHFDVQLIGGIVLHEGNIAEMKTGEGKTLVSTLPVYLNALSCEGVHVITANSYLASRDREQMGRLYEFLGLTVGLNLNGMSKAEKKIAYQCDITYGTSSEFGFDYLRDNMEIYKENLVQRKLNYAIVDEVDSILIDEARTPLIISGQAKKMSELFHEADRFVKGLREEEHYSLHEKEKQVTLTEEGAKRAEGYFKIKNLYDPEHSNINHHIEQALRANVIMKKDVDYVVDGEEVVIVDEYTGRLMHGRQYSNGLHQAIEAKEGVRVNEETTTLATITVQNYFRMYPKLSGMTGTAKTEELEFKNIYKIGVVVIPTNKPMIRKDMEDVIFRTEKGKFIAIIEEIVERYKKGQPVLVGTVSIEKSEYIATLLKKKGIPHTVLNAKYHAKEAEIISQAGQKGVVTIATNMAGRGTDILLGEGVAELGGLHIIGTERHDSRRIDNQLRGRSGRQGDPGSSQFFISVEDDMMKRFGGDNIASIMDRFGVEENQPIQSGLVSRTIETIQKKVEGVHFSSRKNVIQYDDVMNKQREIIYKQRREVLERDSVEEVVLKMIRSSVERAINVYCPKDVIIEEWDLSGLVEEINFRVLGELEISEIDGKEKEEIVSLILKKAQEKRLEKEEQLGAYAREFEKVILLRSVDEEWLEHIDAMDHLRKGIHLRGYAQTDPVREYQIEGFTMFEQMITSIEDKVCYTIMKSRVEVEAKREAVVKEETVQTISSSEDDQQRKPVQKTKVGRNEPCPCGSGKKYKNCCGN